MIEKIKNWWLNFEKEHPAASKWVREGGLFIIVSNLITVFKYLILTFLPLAFAFMGNRDFGFPGIDLTILGTEFKWYIIGYGADEELIRKKIAEAGMEDRVILLGKKANPYPYFKACDFYVQPSRYEGNSVTVNEALILGKKVAITNYATAKSQIDDGVNGVIVPLENEKCAEGLKAFIKDTELQKKIEENIKNSDFSN